MAFNFSGIYKITNTITGKYYIGSAVHISKRWNNHKYQLNKGTHYTKYLQNAWNKYGAQAFEFSILEKVDDKSNLIEREQYWIDILDPVKNGYNARCVAESNLGFTHSESAKIAIQEGNKGRVVSEETRARQSAAKKGVKQKPEHVKARVESAKAKGRKMHPNTAAALKIANLGKPKSESHKANISTAHKGKVLSEAHKAKLRKPTGPQSAEHSANCRAAQQRNKQQREALGLPYPTKGVPHSPEHTKAAKAARAIAMAIKRENISLANDLLFFLIRDTLVA